MVQPRSASEQRSPGGLSILKMALALAFIAVVSIVGIPAFYSQPSITLDNAAVLLARELRFAQNESVVVGVNTRVRFLPEGDGYAVETAHGRALPNPLGGGDLIRVYSRDAIFEGVKITSTSGTHDGMVRFTTRGFCLDEVSVELTYESEIRVLRISKNTGLMEILGLSREWHDTGQ